MAARLNYYFRQRVTEAELDLGFALLEDADQAIITDLGNVGVLSGGVVAQRAGGANASVDVSGLIAYDKLGSRIAFGSSQNVPVAVDENAVSTAVSNPGNTKIVSVFVKFKRLLSDPRTDGNSLTVYFQEGESFDFVVRQGAETNGTPSPPPLDGTYILLADITRSYGVTSITTGNISTARREDSIVAAGTPRALRQGRVKDALSDLLGFYNAHVNGTQDKHPATAIPYGGSGNWADASAVVSNNVEAALDEVVSDLADTTGSNKIGGAAYAPANGIFNLAAGSVQAQLRALADKWDRPDYLPVGSVITGNLVIAANDGKAQIRVNTAGGALSITLPPAASAVGRRLYINDVTGSFGTFNCTIVRNASEKIQGLAASRVLSAPWGSYTLWCDGTDWFMS